MGVKIIAIDTRKSPLAGVRNISKVKEFLKVSHLHVHRPHEGGLGLVKYNNLIDFIFDMKISVPKQ